MAPGATRRHEAWKVPGRFPRTAPIHAPSLGTMSRLRSTPFVEALGTVRSDDGGFGPRPRSPSEPEPTALAAIALDDSGARSWLEEHQREDGSLGHQIGSVRGEDATALGALAMDGDARERALDVVVTTRAAAFESTDAIPFDERFVGWPWTRDAFGWVEPTAHAVLALRLYRPDATDALAQGLGTLRDRECVGGGWNYGNRIVLGEELPPFAQTTAIAMLALQGLDDDVHKRGMERLRALWRAEADGALTLAQSVAALRVHDDPDHTEAAAALAEVFERTAFLDNVATLAWAAIATGDGLERIRVTT